MGCIDGTGRFLLFFILALLLVAGIAVAAEGGVGLGTLTGIQASLNRTFATYVLYCATGAVMVLAALGGLIGALGGRASWLLCAWIFLVVALAGITASAVMATLAYVDFTKDEPANSLAIWSMLVPSVAQQFQNVYQCTGWETTATTTGCSASFTKFIHNTMLGTMIGGWACLLVVATAIGIAICTRDAIKKNKAAKKAAVEADALNKARVQVTSANTPIVSNGTAVVPKATSLPAGAPALTMTPAAEVATVGALSSQQQQPMRPSESTYTLTDPAQQQTYYTQPYSSYASPAPASPAMSYAPLPGGNASLQPYSPVSPSQYSPVIPMSPQMQSARPLSTVSVAPSQLPPSGEDIMMKV